MRNKQFTQHQKIIGYMANRKDQQEWFFAYDFMPPRMTLDYVYCVGYEATARFAELAKRYPEMLESQPAGKYKKRRIRWETMQQWLPHLEKDLRYMFHRASLTKDYKPADPAPAPKPTAPQPAVKSTEKLATYVGRGPLHQFVQGQQYKLRISALAMGKPIVIKAENKVLAYRTGKDVTKDWNFQ